jgi:hypothetical protein
MNNLSQLIEKYFQGETTLEEEKQLRAYFQRGNIEPEWRVYQPLFKLLEVEQNREMGEHFENKVYQKIQPSQKKTRRIFLTHRWIGAVAASLALVFSIWWLYPELSPEPASAINWEQYEPEDPKEAYQITKKALMKVSVELNRGAQKAAREVGTLQDFLKE